VATRLTAAAIGVPWDSVGFQRGGTAFPRPAWVLRPASSGQLSAVFQTHPAGHDAQHVIELDLTPAELLASATDSAGACIVQANLPTTSAFARASIADHIRGTP